MRILGIDPGLRASGYGVIEAVGRNAKMIDYGVIETNAKQPLHERLKIISEGIEEVARKYQPDRMVFEKLSSPRVACLPFFVSLCHNRTGRFSLTMK